MRRGNAGAGISSFRFSLGTLVVGPICFAVSTAVEPSVSIVFLLTMLMLIALTGSLIIDFRLAAKSANTSPQFSLREMFLVVMCLAVYLSVLKNPWPFRIRFSVSRPALELLAAKVEQGESPAGSQWAGLFLIRETERREGYTILWTEPGGGNPMGFVHPAPEDARLFDDWSTARLNDKEWLFFIQD